jgi:hypothetical protein
MTSNWASNWECKIDGKWKTLNGKRLMGNAASSESLSVSASQEFFVDSTRKSPFSNSTKSGVRKLRFLCFYRRYTSENRPN